MLIRIKNLRKEKPTNPWDVRVDRGSRLGNRFIMKNESERDMVCDQYREWFYSNIERENNITELNLDDLFDFSMQDELSMLQGILVDYGQLNLFCWCAPKRCHAATIKEYLEKKIEEMG